MNFTSHKFASILVVQNKKEQTNKKLQVVVNKGIGNTKNLYYIISLKIFMFTPSGKIEGSELRGGCGAYKVLLPP